MDGTGFAAVPTVENPSIKRVIFIDAMGTMLRLLPPWEGIDPAAVAGVEKERIQAAFVAEIAYYVAHIEDGSDADGLADLRRRCARVLSAEAGVEIDVPTMLAAIRFQPFDDCVPALEALGSDGLARICVSNWDCSLPQVLDELELAPLLEGVVSSASAGARKPDPAIFEAALELAGCGPQEALHIGDTDDDLLAARGAGIDVLRIDRAPGHSRSPSGGEIASLLEIRQHPALQR